MRLLIAGGGTGGHLFPALATARAVRAEDPHGSILFVGTRRGIESRIMPRTGFPIRYITARGIRRTGPINSILAGLELPLALVQSFAVIREFRPTQVLGVGGFASGPTVLAAVLLRIPTAIQEQNSVMGTTNRILSRFVDRIYTSWEDTVPVPPAAKTLLTGNPVRADLLEGSRQTKEPGKLNVLIFGGSRGARSINESLADNMTALAGLADRIRVLHQTGLGAAEPMKTAYREAGLEAEVVEFIHEMGPAYRWADLVVCRSGAGSLAELTALGIPAIVVPYPYAIGDHQARNASVLERRNAVRIVPDEKLKNGALVREIQTLGNEPNMLRTMAENSRKLGRPDAARTIALDLLARERSRT
ncbi:MAG: undecaprenyldiphospho-muramoylpentapeptide beta-N-acetylglucosaminyltransferase [Desulfomonilaceae bacterium]|nr:undecaprenyldiphospho-muramoylpentapeptide beta-N-acetylglucosaminyltransferase [Desulfomonilaceae bacterium]